MEPYPIIISKKTSENHWLAHFAGTTLQGDIHQHPAAGSSPSAFLESRITHCFGETLSAQLLEISKGKNINVYKLFLAAVATVIHRNFQLENFTVNTCGLSLDSPSESPADGLLFFLFRISEDTTVKEVLHSIHEQILSGIPHQEYDLATFFSRYEANNLGPADTLLNFGLFDDSRCHSNAGFTRNRLKFLINRKDDDLFLVLSWDTGIYEAPFIQCLSDHIAAFLENMPDNLDRTVSDSTIATASEKKRLLNLSGNTDQTWEHPDSVLPMILRQIQLDPHKTAIVFGDKRIDYATLYRQAAVVGHFLRSNLHTSREDMIGLIMTPSEMTIISMLGVMMSGCAFLPIDAYSPRERITSMLDDSRCGIILTNIEIPFSIDKAACYSMTDILSTEYNEIEVPATPISGDQLACVLYTSGTTGKPKGVLWEHRPLCNHINWFIAEFGLSHRDSTILATSYTFDGCHAYIWSLLSVGGTLHIPESHLFDPVMIVRCMTREKITFLKVVPTVFSEILKTSAFLHSQLSAHLRFIMLGGEVIRLGDLKVLFSGFPAIHVVNHYGPTENTIGSCFHRITRDSLNDFIRRPVIGAPLSNVKAYILNDRLQLSAFLEKGQIAVGGISLTKRGYLNMPHLTREKFIPNPFNPTELLYKTGDYGRWLPNGTIEFLGRMDGQVKVGGIRIELGEIESLLLKLEKVSQCIVVLTDLGATDPDLVAYIVTTEPRDNTYYKEYLKDFLPPAMIPGIYIPLDRVPVTPRGKVDKKALPLPQKGRTKGGSTGFDNKVQQELWKIWEKLLVADGIDLDQNFFSLGGNSLKSIQMTLAINRLFDVELQLNDVFQHPTIRRLAEIVENRQKNDRLQIRPLPAAGYYDTSGAQKGIWIISQTKEGSLAYTNHYAFQIAGDLDIPILQKAFDALIDRFEILRTSFSVIGGDLRQIVHPSMDTRIDVIDIRQIPDRDTIIDDVLKNTGARPFQLDQGPLIRATLVITDSNKYLFYISLHHIISDAWSLNVLITELISLYTAHLKKEIDNIPPLRIHYKDYVGWLNDKLSGATLEQYEDFWLSRFPTGIPLMDFPTDFLRPKQLTYEGDLIIHTIARGSLVKLTECCKRKEITPSVFLLSTVYLMLFKYTGSGEIVIGLPVSGRVNEELENQVGLFLNTLLLNVSIDTDLSFDQFLQRVNADLHNVYNYQLYPLDSFADKIDHTRDSSHNALFDILVDFHLDHEIFTKPAIDNLSISPLPAAEKYSQYDLSLDFLQTTRELNIAVSYNTRLFKPATIRRFINLFENLLQHLLRDDQPYLKEIALSSQPAFTEPSAVSLPPFAKPYPLPLAGPSPTVTSMSSTDFVTLTKELTRSTAGRQIDVEGLQCIRLTGEPVSQATFNGFYDLFPAIKVIYEYPHPQFLSTGITHEFQPSPDNTIPIGTASGNIRAIILDSDLQPLPPGVTGQIYLQTNTGALTATGDLGYQLEDGKIYFAARKYAGIDSVGTNLNLRFVEDLLNQIAGIDCALIIPSKDAAGHPATFAFYTSGSGWAPEYPGNLIPAYLYPSKFIKVATLQTSTGNRIDIDHYRSLQQAVSITDPSTTPGHLDDQLVSIWNDILGPRDLASTDNFFLAGGNSIKAVQLMTSIYKEMGYKLYLKDILDHPTIEQLDRLLKERHREFFEAIPPVAPATHYQASHAQTQIWILSQSSAAAITQNMMDIFPLSIDYNFGLLRSAFDLLLERHEILRTTFQFLGGELFQVIRPVNDLGFSFDEVHFTNPETIDADVNHFFAEYRRRKFPLADGPLVRAAILKPIGYSPTLVISMSHIIGDGLSGDILLRDFRTLYQHLEKGTPYPLKPLKIQYKDFAAWHNTLLSGATRQKFKDWWAQTLDHGNISRTELPLDYHRPEIRGHKGDELHFSLDKQVTEAISQICSRQQATVFMFHLAVFNILLFKSLSQNDLVIGIPVGGRPHADLDDQVGLYLNSVPLRTILNDDDTFIAVLGRIKTNLTAAMEMQLYPFDLLITDLNIARPENGGNPLFDIVFNWFDNNGETADLQPSGLPHLPLNTTTTTSKHDLMASGAVGPEGTQLSFDYDTEIFKRQSIGLLSSQYLHLIDRITLNQDQKVCELVASDIVSNTDIAHYF
jgi:amino acid adenylation domain-containing protein